jgi:uncharacterized protein YdcH (DUF465 family)
MTKEKLIHHLQHLSEKHAKLDQEIDRAEATGVFVDEELHVLKKQRLALRDEMEATSMKIETFQKVA